MVPSAGLTRSKSSSTGLSPGFSLRVKNSLRLEYEDRGRSASSTRQPVLDAYTQMMRCCSGWGKWEEVSQPQPRDSEARGR